MFELEPQAWSAHLAALGLVNAASVGLVVWIVRRMKYQDKEFSKMREQCRRVEDHLMALRRSIAAMQRSQESSRETEAPSVLPSAPTPRPVAGPAPELGEEAA